MQPSKTKLRQYYRDVRSHIPIKERETAAKEAAHIFAHETIVKRSEHIACYLPYKDEFDSKPVIEAIWLAKKHCYLPVLAEKESGNTLYFVRYNNGDPLHFNRYGILEPLNVARTIAPENLELVITPLIAFDLAGHRLGTGGGYYDRTFAFIHQPAAKKPQMVGLGYSLQLADAIPFDPWDIALDGMITEKQFISFDPHDYEKDEF